MFAQKLLLIPRYTTAREGLNPDASPGLPDMGWFRAIFISYAGLLLSGVIPDVRRRDVKDDRQ
jgi:hypothetical protein